ncbi:hypothetical protein TNCV_1172521 [Trichonephila clavipes]|uniref:Uncharacterized protein n=1 Tax=Trichonephila clavipes TaxID=2585209 RepID=A0A8X6VCW8_TRICX|nr:hypothetical protein TNCV_1172521 [Trichonephila clavipes]
MTAAHLDECSALNDLNCIVKRLLGAPGCPVDKPAELEACGEKALPHKTVTRRVTAFLSGRNETVYLQLTGRPSIPQDQIDILSSLLSLDCPWTVQDLPLEDYNQSEKNQWTRGPPPHPCMHRRSQSSIGAPHNEEVSEREENCFSLDSNHIPEE